MSQQQKMAEYDNNKKWQILLGGFTAEYFEIFFNDVQFLYNQKSEHCHIISLSALP